MAQDRVPMTREGYEKEKSRLEHMRTIEMIEVAKRIAEARALGDLSENAEYHAAREDQGHLQARIDSLKDKLARAYIVDPLQPAARYRRVRARACSIKDLDDGEEEVYDLVGPGEEDYDNNKILTTSPAARPCSAKRWAMSSRSRCRAASFVMRCWRFLFPIPHDLADEEKEFADWQSRLLTPRMPPRSMTC